MNKENKTKEISIEGLSWDVRKAVTDHRGSVKLMLKDDEFKFPVKEIYFSLVNPLAIKGWKFHKEMWQRFSVPVGRVKFVFVDLRESSGTFGQINEWTFGGDLHGVLTVPPKIWYSFKALDESASSLIVNAASMSRRDGESISQDLADFSHYVWK
jgi:dTDP-4-dehydrorhamnose 3,5-epimerase